MVADVPNWFFSTCAFIGFVLCMIPLPWHLEGNFIVPNYHTFSNVLLSLEHGHLPVHDLDGLGVLEPIHQFRGLEFGCHQQGPGLVRHLYVSLPFFIGASHHSRTAAHFMVASAVAIPAASLCINRRLYQIASVQSVTKTRAQKRRDVIVDLAIGVGLPIIGMILRECYCINLCRIVTETCLQTSSFKPNVSLLWKKSVVTRPLGILPLRTLFSLPGLSSLAWYQQFIAVRVPKMCGGVVLIPFYSRDHP